MNNPRRTTTVAEAAFGVAVSFVVSGLMLGTILVAVHLTFPNGLSF